jgi:multiple sugar transport system permease protein
VTAVRAAARPVAPPRSGAAGTALVSRSGILATAFMFVCAVYFLLPAWWLVVSSTKGPSTLYASEGFWFRQLHLVSNLTGLFRYDNGIYWHWLVNTLMYAGLGALCATLLASAAGYALAKYEFRGRQLVFSVILGGVLVPGTALALPLYLLMSKVSLTNTYWSVFLPSIVSPFGVYLARVYAAAAIPDDLIEAGRIDGASEVRIFAAVGLRIMAPALVTMFLFQFVLAAGSVQL